MLCSSDQPYRKCIHYQKKKINGELAAKSTVNDLVLIDLAYGYGYGA